ncbi:MAG: hypothetical protein ACREFP_18605 [Acetobacteraceae bacterium]
MPATPARSTASIGLIIVIIVELLIISSAYADVSTADLRLKAADVFSHTIDLLITLDLALFALVGYFAKDRLSASGRRRIIQLTLLFFFFVAGCTSLYFAYSGQLEIGAQLYGGGFDYQHLHDYVLQALTLLAATALAFFFLVAALLK